MTLYIIIDTEDNTIQAIWFDRALALSNLAGLGEYYEMITLLTSDDPIDEGDHYNPAYGYGV